MIYAGSQDGQIFTKNGEKIAYNWLVIARNPAYVNLPGNEDKHEWQALNWSGKLEAARKNAKAAGRNYYQVSVIPVFAKTGEEVNKMQEDSAQYRKALKEGEEAYNNWLAEQARIEAEEEAARQAEERAEADQAREEADILENWQERLGDISADEGIQALIDFDTYMNENRDRILAEIREEDKQTQEERAEAEEAPEAQPEKLGPVPYAPSLICKACGKLLSGPESIARGYGDKCWRKVWRYVRGNQEPEAPKELCKSMTSPKQASETLDKIHRRITDSEEACICGRPAWYNGIYSYDHDGGYMLAGFEKPQWVFTKCQKCGHELSLRKMHTVDIEDLETEGRREAGKRLAEEEARKAGQAPKQKGPRKQAKSIHE